MAAAAVSVARVARAAMVVWPWARAARVLMAVAARVVPAVVRVSVVMVLPVRPVVPGHLLVVRAATAVMPVPPVVRVRPG
jgi:hypothetical protein